MTGFVIEKAFYVDSLGFFASLLFKFLGNAKGNLNPKMVKMYELLLFPTSCILDHFFHNWFGKSLLVISKRPK
jgi:hypothetical protein